MLRPKKAVPTESGNELNTGEVVTTQEQSQISCAQIFLVEWKFYIWVLPVPSDGVLRKITSLFDAVF